MCTVVLFVTSFVCEFVRIRKIIWNTKNTEREKNVWLLERFNQYNVFSISIDRFRLKLQCSSFVHEKFAQNLWCQVKLCVDMVPSKFPWKWRCYKTRTYSTHTFTAEFTVRLHHKPAYTPQTPICICIYLCMGCIGNGELMLVMSMALIICMRP